MALVCDACGTVTIVNYCSQVHIQAAIVNYCQLQPGSCTVNYCQLLTCTSLCSQVHIQADIVNYCQLHVVRSTIALFCDYCSQVRTCAYVHVRATVALLSTVALH